MNENLLIRYSDQMEELIRLANKFLEKNISEKDGNVNAKNQLNAFIVRVLQFELHFDPVNRLGNVLNAKTIEEELIDILKIDRIVEIPDAEIKDSIPVIDVGHLSKILKALFAAGLIIDE